MRMAKGNLVQSKEKLNTEMLWRKSMSMTVHEYLSNCSLAGFKCLANDSRNKYEKIMWFLVIFLAIAGVVYLMKATLDEFLGMPIVITLESTQHPIWKVPFPGVALCNINRISRRAALEYAELLQTRANRTIPDVELNVRMLGRLLDFEIEDFDSLIQFMADLEALDADEYGVYNVTRKMQELSPSCEELLVSCRWQGRPEQCSRLFQTRRTIYGHCCTFNYVRMADDFGRPTGAGDNQVLKSMSPGHGHGLTVLLDPQIEDYAYPIHSSEGTDILIFSPYDYADASSGGLVHRLAPLGMEAFFTLSAATVWAVPDVERFSFKQRGCRFRNELRAQFSGRYSYSDCVVACRTRAVLALCHCAPYALPTRPRRVPACTLNDLPCLNKYRQKLKYLNPQSTDEGLATEQHDALFCPECVPDCAITRYNARAYFAPLTTASIDMDIGGVDLANRSLLHIYFSSANTNLFKMDVVYYWFELVSNMGGIGGLFLGFSLISVVEIIYFFCIRFFIILKQNRRENY